jgi:chorismate lyase / 3-hydroxybenzoate synthase
VSATEHEIRSSPARSGLDIFYVADAAAERWSRDESVVAVIRFGSRTSIEGKDRPQISIALPPLGAQRYAEVWRTHLPMVRGREGDMHYALDEEMLFGCLLVDDAADLSIVARSAYARVLELTHRLGYPHLARVWNYFSGINGDYEGLERYRAFCVGRYEAFSAFGYRARQLAAASAIGTHAPGLLLYFIAAREAGTPIENPRQVSAFRYPLRYSPRHPLFSRAMIKHWECATHLYISGTASVVGHRTCHPEDTLEQLRETARNIEAVVSRAKEAYPFAIKSARQLSHVKIYVRRAEDLFRIQSEFDRLFSPGLPRIFVHADICRPDLLLEIDAFYSESLTA